MPDELSDNFYSVNIKTNILFVSAKRLVFLLKLQQWEKYNYFKHVLISKFISISLVFVLLCKKV